MGVKCEEESAEMSDNLDITEDEAALYDRQIRLWGVECQKQIRAAKILLIGLNGLGVEVAKNLALSGVKSITILDSALVSEADHTAQFFAVGATPTEGSTVFRADASRAGIQELNPNVKIIIDKESVCSKDKDYYKQFNAVFASSSDMDLLIQLNTVLRELNIMFFCGSTWGFYGFGFLDLITRLYCDNVQCAHQSKTGPPKTESLFYCTMSTALAAKVGSGLRKRVNNVYLLLQALNHFRKEHGRMPSPATREEDIERLKKTRKSAAEQLGCPESRCSDEMLSNVFGELSPVCAAVGGVMANEIIKGVTNADKSMHNFLLFDGDECNATVESIPA